MATFDEFYASLDADSNVRGDQFEKKFALWFLKTDPTWASQVEGVWRWDDYPKRSEWGTDCGVDIILHHRNGERWAVQAKCFSPENYLNKDELNSFIAESSDDRFQGKLLISSTNKIGPNADKLLKRHKVVRILLKDLRDSDINYPSSIKNLYLGSPLKKYDAKPHQKEAIKDVLKRLKKVNKGQVIMACGSGKTLTALWIKEKLFAKNTLVLLPSLSLVRQTVKNWNTHKSQTFKWLCICSDQTVARDKKNKDEWITNTSELGISVTSDLSNIKEFLLQSGCKVVFSTYQSSKLICDAHKLIDGFKFDLTIADEAHNCSGRKESYFGNILDDKKINTTKKLFFTATPKILSTRIKSKSKEKNIAVASMDDKNLFGEVLHRLSFSDAIKGDILSNYKVIIVGVDNEEIKQKISKRDLISTNGEYIFDSESLATFIAIIKSIKNYKIQKLISFHNRIKHAEVFADNLPRVLDNFNQDLDEGFKISSSFVEGKMNATEKDEKIQQLNSVGKNSCFILSNARCLSEGVDVPTLDGVAFVDPKHSAIDIVQAVGRAIRKSDNKKEGIIIVPVFLDEIKNLDKQILATKFQTVWSVILALKAQDDELLEKIDELRIQLGRRKITKITKKGLEKIYFDLPDNINPEFYDSLYTLLIENTSDDWLENYGKFQKFLADNEGRNISHLEFGRWVGIQRYNFKLNKLSEDRISLLNKIPEWIWDEKDFQWNQKFELLKTFIVNNGHACPHQNKSKLGPWVTAQRQLYKNGELDQKRIDKLNSLSEWMWDKEESEWYENYFDLKKYEGKNHHTYPPQNTPLGGWCKRQRTIYSNGDLEEIRIEKLESLTYWHWEYKKDLDFKNNIKELKKFSHKNKHTYPEKPPLKSWVYTQRKQYREKNILLTAERIKMLEAVEHWNWDSLERYKWNKKFDIYLIYLEEKDLLDEDTIKNILGWRRDQRARYAKKYLEKYEIDKLESTPNWSWDPLNENWLQSFEDLKDFITKNETLPTPKTNRVLAEWIRTQKRANQKNRLSQERIDLLSSIGINLKKSN